ncbi:MAG: LacI family DNA-binding transcriptional regulator [Dermatophilaceae bacterium]
MSETGSPLRPASVKDVAAAAGVSLGTVSNVLNRPDQVSEATRLRVQQAMDALGFVRNESARQLRAGRSRVLAYVVLDIANPFFSDVALGAEEVAEESGLALFLSTSHQDAAREHSSLVLLAQQRVHGVLVTPVDPDDPMLDVLPERGIPVVLVDRTREQGTHCSVSVDDELGGRLAVEHLLELGHTSVAFVGGPERLGQVRERRAGARSAIRAAGLPDDALVEVATGALTVDEGRTAADRLISLPPARRPTAAMCANDLVALGVLQRCVARGVHVPGELSIVGYDDIEFAEAAAVPLTSVRQPRRDLGRTAVRLLADETSNPEHRHEQVVFTPQLVARASTARR